MVGRRVFDVERRLRFVRQFRGLHVGWSVARRPVRPRRFAWFHYSLEQPRNARFRVPGVVAPAGGARPGRRPIFPSTGALRRRQCAAAARLIRGLEGRPGRSEAIRAQAVRDPVNEPLGQTPRAGRAQRRGSIAAVGLLASGGRGRRAGCGRRLAARRRSPTPLRGSSLRPRRDGGRLAATTREGRAGSGGGQRRRRSRRPAASRSCAAAAAAPAASLIIDVPQALGLRLPPAPDRRLDEKSRFGLLPRVGADGARPADVYARPVFASAKLKPGAPRVALLVGGLGLDPRQHRRRDRAASGRRLARLRALRRPISSATRRRRAKRVTKSCCSRRWSL